MSYLTPFLIALQFLTVIPIKLSNPPSGIEVGRSALYYPLVGLLIGLMIVGVGEVMDPVSQLLRGALLLTVWVMVTGALHLDGLADSADAWLGGQGDRKRTLAIMKDPSCGPGGVVSLVLILLVKFSALVQLEPAENGFALILVPMYGRTALQLIFLTTPYVRPAGLGQDLSANLPRSRVLAIILLAVLYTVLALGLEGVLLTCGSAVVFVILRRSMIKRIGGVTGDTAGALVELIETTALVVLTVTITG